MHISFFAAALLLSVGSPEVKDRGAPVDLELPDHHGKVHRLADLADKKAIVIAFLGVECPLAKLYAPRLNELAKEYESKGVAFLAVDSNQQDSATELGAFARIHELSFPMLKDAGNVFADKIGAQRTPEVFVLDGGRRVCYSGRIDDQYGAGSSSGYAKPKIQRKDLALAIDQVLAQKRVETPRTVATGCLIGRVSKVEPHGDVTYTRQIARILQDRCVECHRPGEIAPFSLTSYEEVVGWAPTIREVVSEQRMPPWFADPAHGKFANDARLTEQQKKDIATWIANGCPKGDAADLPESKNFVDGWRISKPDQVVYMSDEPYTVPAEGVVEYKYFTADPGFKEDKWLQAIESRPGNRSVVHHIIVFIQPPGSSGRGGGLEGGTGAVGGYAPGEQPRIYPPGVAIKVPAGSKFVFQMHYTPNGSVQQDRSYIGMKFVDAKTVTRPANGGAAINTGFTIPAGADDHAVSAKYRFRKDALLTMLFPHMHLRGKSFRFEATYPDGKKEILLDVPRWDFNWQLRYELAEPKLMPAGTEILCLARFDNSSENLANPDPNKPVRWGPQTWEEMMIGFLGSIPTVDQDPTKPAPSPVKRKSQQSSAAAKN